MYEFMSRPSFILFITDQHRADYLGCYGHPIVRTPAIDAIARRGVAFDRFYVASPVCMPNRASLMTGRMPSVHGVRGNGWPLSRAAVTFVDLLAHGGYDTALIGKSHLLNFTGIAPTLCRPSPRNGFTPPPPGLADATRHDLDDPAYGQECPPFWQQADPRLQLPFYGFQHVELTTGHGDYVGGHYRAWLAAREPGAEKLVGAANQLAHDYVCPQAIRTALPAALYPTSYIAERATAYLAERAKSSAPFFLMVSFPDPHHPFNPPGRYWDMYSPAQFAVPEAFLRTDWRPPPHVAAVHALRDRGGTDLKGMSTIAVTQREAQEAQALTCGLISCIDDAIAGVMAALAASGREDETVVMFTSDHGDHLGDHRLLLKGAEQYQSILRVPFVWSDPADPALKGVRSDALASTIDIAATVLERAQLEPYCGLQGRNLAPAMTGARLREAALVEFEHQTAMPGLGVPPRVHTVIDDRYRLSLLDGLDWGELYDLQADPGEFVNLWDDAASVQIKARLMELLARQRIAFVDRSPMPRGRA